MRIMEDVTITVTHNVDEATIVTHPAPHHADETMAVVIATIIEGSSATILQTRDASLIERAVANKATICDVGEVYDPEANRFDHHQRGLKKVRPQTFINKDGEKEHYKYSSAGLLWKEYGSYVCRIVAGCTTLDQAKEVASRVDEMLILGIDAIDNGQALSNNDNIMSVSQVISLLNPNWNEEKSIDEDFILACDLACLILTRTIRSCAAVVKGRDTVEDAIRFSENDIMILPRFIGGWTETVVKSMNPKASRLLYGIFENLQGQWNVQAIPLKGDPRAQRKPLPEAWRGLSNVALREATGVEDAIFCHAGGFVCGARSKKGAIRLAELAVGPVN